MDFIPVILNPAARSSKASGRLEAIQELSPRVKLCPTSGPGDARRIAREWAERGTPVVVAAGGDGTINEVVNGLRDAGPAHQTALGLLPAGTMNVFSVELGLPTKSLVDCWQIIERNQRRQIDLWDANGHAFMQLAGIGLDAAIIKHTTWERKKALGPLSYILSAAQLIGREAPQVTITAPGREPLLGSVVLVGNGKRYGGPLKVFPKADNADGLLDVVVLRQHSYRKLFGAMFSLLVSGSDKHSRDLVYFQTTELRIEFDAASGLEIPVEADGELIPCTMPLILKQAERSLTVLV